jgi:protein TIF31
VLTSSYKNSKVWLKEKSNQPHKWNANISTEDEFSSEPNCLKDWNEMLQSQSTLPTNTLLDRLNKSKMLIKVYNEFVGTALQGAKALVEGRLSPLNPLDDKLQHIYINNSIFYSMAHETPFDYSQEKGIDATPSVTAINSDLRNLGVLMGLDIKDLHVLHMVLI